MSERSHPTATAIATATVPATATGTVTLERQVERIVETSAGAVRGSVEDRIHVFRGVPYAEPPFGPLRLRPPQRRQPWSGVKDALAFGPEPPQPRMPDDHPAAGMVWDPAQPGEDCLNLNIWTPTLGSSGLPVMVWIPGGMFEVGTGATYDGSRFARDGVVCVTINYRVGAEGFMALADGTPNLGLLDQIAALEWVRDEIAVFGGDPDRVTVFGESAGAMSIGALLAMPRAAGLFRRAILESGACDRVISAETADRMTRHLARRLGVPATLEALARIEPDRLVATTLQLKDEMRTDPDPAIWGQDVIASGMPWQPVIDGDVLPGHPLERIAAGAAAGVDIIAGSNLDDWALFVAANGSFERVTDEILEGTVATDGFETAAAYGVDAPMLAAYRRAMPGAPAPVFLAAIETDWWCRVPALRLAEARRQATGRTFMYEFCWRSPVAGPMGACHAMELPFVFDTLDLGPSQMLGGLLGPEPPQALADAVHGAWVAFATTGDPGWPPYEPGRRATMRFDVASAVVDDPRAFERGLWGVGAAA